MRHNFVNRRNVEQEIERTKNPPPGTLNFNDSKERVTLPGGTLEYMLRLIDQLAEQVQKGANT